ncbi:cytochrome P450 [Fennellomyces sp. T-0311]|nr:cytochrome P450 [Fennellomyces sp. T-0311]
MDGQAILRQYAYTYRYYIGITAAVSIVCQQVYYRIFRIPKTLRHIPAISYWRQVRALMRNEPITPRTKRLVYPLLSKANGIYLNRMPFDWTVYVANPMIAKTVLFKPEFATKMSLVGTFSEDSAIVQLVGKDNVAVSNGHLWKKQRKIMNPVFHRSMPVATFGNLMPKVFHIIDQTQSRDANVVAIQLMHRLTLEVLGKAIFGFEFGGLDNENSIWVSTYNKVFEGLVEFTTFFPRIDAFLRWFSSTRRARYNATFKLVGLLDEMTEKRRQELLDAKESSSRDIPDHEKDLLTLMLEAEIRGEIVWEKDELRHNIAMFFVAGHDTTANALTFAIYSLAVNKDVQNKARKEILDLLGDEPRDIHPTLDDCKRMPYIDMIIKETLRMNAPANDLLARIASEDLELGGVIIPKGTMVSVDFHALHFRPDTWTEPERFIPERFEENGEHSKHEGVTWVPFSGGTRQCIGINFSMMEQRVALSMLLRKYEWELPAGSIHQDGLVMDKPFSFAPTSLEIKFNKRY